MKISYVYHIRLGVKFDLCCDSNSSLHTNSHNVTASMTKRATHTACPLAQQECAPELTAVHTTRQAHVRPGQRAAAMHEACSWQLRSPPRPPPTQAPHIIRRPKLLPCASVSRVHSTPVNKGDYPHDVPLTSAPLVGCVGISIGDPSLTARHRAVRARSVRHPESRHQQRSSQ